MSRQSLLHGLAFNYMFRTFGLLSISLGLVACTSFQRPHYRSNNRGYTTSASQRNPQNYKGPFQLNWPVENGRLSQRFKNYGGRPHHGIDISGRRNTPILAAHEGHVIYAGSGFKGYGKMVIVKYDDTWATLYAHLNRIHVREGQYVYGEDKIGGMGRTGRATGVHLHFELMKNELPVNPLPLLQNSQRLVKN